MSAVSWPIVAFFALVVFVATSRPRRHVRQPSQAVRMALLIALALAASQPRAPAPPPPPPPDERRRAATPPQGVPVASVDAGAPDGGTTMLAADPETRLAGGEVVAVECGPGFDQVPCPTTDPQAR